MGISKSVPIHLKRDNRWIPVDVADPLATQQLPAQLGNALITHLRIILPPPSPRLARVSENALSQTITPIKTEANRIRAGDVAFVAQPHRRVEAYWWLSFFFFSVFPHQGECRPTLSDEPRLEETHLT